MQERKENIRSKRRTQRAEGRRRWRGPEERGRRGKCGENMGKGVSEGKWKE